MLLELLTRKNNISYNVKFAKLFGIYSAIYLGMLLDCFYSNTEELLKLSREEIYNYTGIEETKQIEVEQNLTEYKIITVSQFKNNSSKSYYTINLDRLVKFAELPLESSTDTIKFDETEEVKTATKAPSRLSKRACIVNNLKKAITIQDPTSISYLNEWIDGVMQRYNFLSKLAVEDICERFSKLANGRVTILRELCKTAAITLYKDPQYIINKYNTNGSSNNYELNDVTQAETTDNLNKLKNYQGDTF